MLRKRRTVSHFMSPALFLSNSLLFVVSPHVSYSSHLGSGLQHQPSVMMRAYDIQYSDPEPWFGDCFDAAPATVRGQKRTIDPRTHRVGVTT